MTIQKNNLIYFIIAIILSSLIAIASGLEDTTLKILIILGILGVIVTFAIFLNPSLGAYILIIAIFTNISRQVTDRGYPGVILPIIAIVFTAIFARYFYANHNADGGTKTSKIMLFIFLYFLVIALSYFAASDKDRTLGKIMRMGKDIIIVYCIVFALRRLKDWKQAVWIVIITTSALCLLGGLQMATGNYSQTFFGMASVSSDTVLDEVTENRLGGPINTPNIWGQVLVAVIPLVAYRIVDKPRQSVLVFCVLTMGLILYAILNTYSRGAYLVALLLFALLFIVRRLNPLILIAMIGLSMSIIVFAPASYVGRFESLLSLSPTSEYGVYEDSSLRGRSSEMLTGLKMFLKYPLLGVGASNYENNYQKYAQEVGMETRLEERQAHSLYIQILAETGVLGAVTFGGTIITLMSGLYKARKIAQQIEGARSWRLWLASIYFSVSAYLTTSIFLHDAYIRYFWILVALAIASIQITENIKNNPKLLFEGEAQF